MLRLYYTEGTCALASHIVLEEVGADFLPIRIGFDTNQQNSPEYLAINPKGRVPALVTPRGVLTETPAMLVFIAQSFPHAKLAPLDDAFAFAQVQSFNSFICSSLHVAHSHRMRGYRWATEQSSFEDMQRKVPDSVGGLYRLVEQHMFRGPWVMGDAYSICDPYLFTLAQWMEGDGVDPSDFPKVKDHRQRMLARASVRKAIADEMRG